jgi:hypothetical protein
MESRAQVCPTCGSADLEFVEPVWESSDKDHNSNVAPPVPRDAATNLGRFYRWGIFWLVITAVATLILRNHGAARVEQVFNVTVLGVMAGIYQVFRLLTGRPKPTADQEAALAEWHVAHAQWEQTRVCLRCGTLLPPPNVGA